MVEKLGWNKKLIDADKLITVFDSTGVAV